VNIKIRRHATRAALAASAVPALVMARGNRIDEVPEIPLVVPNTVEALEKTKDAVKLLKEIGCYSDVQKCIDTKHIRAGKGKRRNRKFNTRKGPILMVSKKCEAAKAFRNLCGVDVMKVDSMNLLKLCPGGHVGRMIIWTEDAFKALNDVYRMKTPRQVDSKRVINSEEVQAILRKKLPSKKRIVKRSPSNRNPALKAEKKAARKAHAYNTAENLKDPKRRSAKVAAKRAAKKTWTARVTGKEDRKGNVPTKTPKGTKSVAKKPVAKGKAKK